jgi:hypothetical protein
MSSAYLAHGMANARGDSCRTDGCKQLRAPWCPCQRERRRYPTWGPGTRQPAALARPAREREFAGRLGFDVFGRRRARPATHRRPQPPAPSSAPPIPCAVFCICDRRAHLKRRAELGRGARGVHRVINSISSCAPPTPHVSAYSTSFLIAFDLSGQSAWNVRAYLSPAFPMTRCDALFTTIVSAHTRCALRSVNAFDQRPRALRRIALPQRRTPQAVAELVFVSFGLRSGRCEYTAFPEPLRAPLRGAPSRPSHHANRSAGRAARFAAFAAKPGIASNNNATTTRMK